MKGEAVRPPRAARPSEGHPVSSLEIRLKDGRLDLSERYSDDRTDQLLAALRRLGVHCEERFRSPCG